MIIKETTNLDDIKEVLCHPEIYDTISTDKCPPVEELDIPIDDNCRYVVGYIKGEPIGVMVYHKVDDKNFCHVQVLPEYRCKYALEFGEKSLNFRGKEDLYAVIPDLYKNVLAFAILNNFEVVDVKESGYIKNGKNYNVNVLKYKGD